MKTVSEISKQTGVSVRTLHYYDAIGLLPPASVTEAGYRLYDDAALCRLQSILLFRELQFPLKEIKAILDDPHFDPQEALTQQIRLLEWQRQHIDRLIAFARQIQEKGVETMDFTAFDTREFDQYKAEAKAKWGGTPAYREYEQKAKSGADFQAASAQLMAQFAALGRMQHLSPADPAVQEEIGALQNTITQNFYTCTREILQGLGQMYTGDERFRRQIDRAGGAGTADFVKQAIDIYCGQA